MQQTCGNCGKPVGASDITCPHCDALLAAYATPTGATSATTRAGSEPVADAVPPVKIDEPAPASKIEISDEVEVVSTAPRPLFDTHVTIDELMQAAEGDNDETLLVVDEEKVASKPMEFDRPDYARPPSAAEPVPVVGNADPGLIARQEPDRGPTPALKPLPEDRPTVPAGETWLDETLPAAPDTRQREPGREREIAEQVTAERGRTEEYLRRLHAQTGYDSGQAARSRPVDTRTRPTAPPIVNTLANDATIRKSRQGCLGLLYIVLFFLWMGVIGGLLDGDLRSGTILLAIALSFIVRLVHAVPANARTR